MAARDLGLMAGALLLAGACRAGSAAAAFDAVVTHVSDGDTVWVRSEPAGGAERGRRIKLRIVGIDAPERCQAHGERAAAALAAVVQGRRVSVQRGATDDYGRALGTLWIDGQDVGRGLVAEGHAWSARWHGNAGPYAREEEAARGARRGLFADPAPELPREFRRRHGPCP